MDEQQYSTWMDALAAVPDPRKARGQRFSWHLLLALICSALASGQQSGHGIANWVEQHAVALLKRLKPDRGKLPSESTLRRALRRLDVAALEQQIAQYIEQLRRDAPYEGCVISPQGEVLQGQAVDGKAVRGASPTWPSDSSGQPGPARQWRDTRPDGGRERKAMKLLPCPPCCKGRSYGGQSPRWMPSFPSATWRSRLMRMVATSEDRQTQSAPPI